MSYSRILGACALTLSLSAAAFAGTDASGKLSLTGFAGGLYDYSITLLNTGTTPIGTFWYAWVPGEDYMATKPSVFTESGGWNAPAVTGSGNATDGYAIRWESPTGLAVGKSAVFTFESASTLGELSGDSIYHQHPPVGTSFLYSRIFPSGSSAEIVVQSVPTPSGVAALGLGLFGLLFRRKARR